MSVNGIERDKAQAALAEVEARGAQLRRADLQLSWMLLAILGACLGVAVVTSLAPHHGSSWAGISVVIMLAGFLATGVLIGLRIRAYSRTGIVLYFASVIGFNVWNAAVTSTSIITRFWAAGQPSYHFGISVAVGSIPLWIGAYLIRRRASRAG
ncbi:MAG TPA: hypothetical protein VEU76_06270 [Candidatus Udaeobacter sp.]|nr:hypothetical protein [Candidatus Udaeobacter sp.]